MIGVRPSPCAFCPYRRDVPSGVWAASEYEMLPDYDKPTSEQPMAVFGCHEKPDMTCAGWAQCHSNRGHAFELLALRIWPKTVPAITTPLFKSGAEASAHGMRDIHRPKHRAVRAVSYLTKLQKKRKRKSK